MLSKEELITFWIDQFIIKDEQIIEVFRKVDRAYFLPRELKSQAYRDQPLPIAKGQTISQPTTVVTMIQELDIEPGNKVLEVGTGSGYQAALLAELVGRTGKVYTTEIHKELADAAKKQLKKWKNITVEHHDGSLGLPHYAPFDRVIISAACPLLPPSVVNQLKEGGVIVAPVGSRYEQEVVRGVKKDNRVVTTSLGRFIFVPLRGKYGFRE